jgi:serine/threonine protein kinase
MMRKLHFELVRRLDSGGRGDVYLGYVREMNLWVAVKYLRESHIPQQRQAFFREIDTLLKGIPGMIRILDFNKVADLPYYVMEYLPGGKLTQHAGRFTQPQSLSLAAGLANALADFHQRCGAHGDYKPDNILVTGDGQLRLGDPAGNGFGFSVLFAPARGGTPGYWAPEIRGNGIVSPQSDVFSFGATLIHLVTGRRPVDGQSFDPWSYGFRCPAALRDVILLCTQIDPKARPSMRQVIRALGGESWESIRDSQRRQEERERNVGFALAAGLFLAFLLAK